MIVRPSSWNSFTRSRHFCWKRSSPTASTSSTSRMSGSMLTATEKPSRTFMPGRVVLHLVVDELLELGEFDDLVESAADLLARQPEQRPVQEDVVAPGQLGLEPCAELQHRRHLASHDDLAGGRLQDSGDALEQGRLARAVAAEDPDRLTRTDLRTDVPEAPRTPRTGRARRATRVLSATSTSRGRGGTLGDVLDLNGGAHRASELLGEVALEAAEDQHRAEQEQIATPSSPPSIST